MHNNDMGLEKVKNMYNIDNYKQLQAVYNNIKLCIAKGWLVANTKYISMVLKWLQMN